MLLSSHITSTKVYAKHKNKNYKYFLEQNWSMDLEELERAYSAAEAKPKAICIINPGNPTGQVLSKG